MERVNPMASQEEIEKLGLRQGGKQLNLRTLKDEIFGKEIYLVG